MNQKNNILKRRKAKKIILWLLLGLFIFAIGFLLAMPLLVMNPMTNKHIDFKKVWSAQDYGMEAEHFFVKTEDGLSISAWEIEAKNPKVVIICISGIHNPSVTAFFGHASLFREHNCTTILFDMRAHGQSEGDRICLGYKEYLDTRAIVQYIKSNPAYKELPIVVFGLSMGGVTAINSIGEIPEIDGLISLSAYSSWEDVFYEQMADQTPVYLAKIVKPFVSIVASVKYGTNAWVTRPKSEIRKLRTRPALLMHSKEDSQVPFSNFERIMLHAPDHVDTFVREGDHHFISESFIKPEMDTAYADKLLSFLMNNFYNE